MPTPDSLNPAKERSAPLVPDYRVVMESTRLFSSRRKPGTPPLLRRISPEKWLELCFSSRFSISLHFPRRFPAALFGSKGTHLDSRPARPAACCLFRLWSAPPAHSAPGILVSRMPPTCERSTRRGPRRGLPAARSFHRHPKFRRDLHGQSR